MATPLSSLFWSKSVTAAGKAEITRWTVPRAYVAGTCRAPASPRLGHTANIEIETVVKRRIFLHMAAPHLCGRRHTTPIPPLPAEQQVQKKRLEAARISALLM